MDFMPEDVVMDVNFRKNGVDIGIINKMSGTIVKILRDKKLKPYKVYSDDDCKFEFEGSRYYITFQYLDDIHQINWKSIKQIKGR